MPEEFICFPVEGFMTPILESADVPVISPGRLDERLVMGWRHFGTKFFRYNFAFHQGQLCGVIPLRLRVEGFEITKSQRRILRRNSDLKVRVVPARHCEDYDRMFERHRTRFTENSPDSLLDFLSPNPAEIPCATMALEVRLAQQLVAVSFMDIGVQSISSVYAMFEPEHSARGLGNFTLLMELEHAREQQKRFHYLGYAYTVPSVYDYKKAFHGVEGYDWGHRWVSLPEDYRWSRHVEIAGEPL